MSVHGAQIRITEALTSWPGVTVQPNHFPGTALRARTGAAAWNM